MENSINLEMMDDIYLQDSESNLKMLTETLDKICEDCLDILDFFNGFEKYFNKDLTNLVEITKLKDKIMEKTEKKYEVEQLVKLAEIELNDLIKSDKLADEKIFNEITELEKNVNQAENEKTEKRLELKKSFKQIKNIFTFYKWYLDIFIDIEPKTIEEDATVVNIYFSNERDDNYLTVRSNDELIWNVLKIRAGNKNIDDIQKKYLVTDNLQELLVDFHKLLNEPEVHRTM